MVLKSWPMKPSGVQLARPILPPGRQTRSSSRAALSWFGVNMTPKVESTASKLASANGSASASASWKVTGKPLGLGALAAALEQRADIVGRHHVGEAARGGEGRIAVAGGDVEHALAAAEIDRFAQRLADDLQRRADDGVVARGPGALLAALDGGEVGLGVGGRLGRSWHCFLFDLG